MGTVVTAIAAAWALLMGAAYCARRAQGSSRTARVAIVACAYACCAVATLIWLGPGQAGLLGITGLLLPAAVALAIALAA